ncbi:hypothetical protein PAT3040_05509 [Paenibacillus agaridevorans]|uniref:Uncharacterized protein n=1 Tax=Paenibacillus agaridevorans TaxID=171404 RepID=A0A2R5EW14_9BACL|nr:hypothetical protein PAT3040_05509 [Paenibacillus agaridevorans]
MDRYSVRHGGDDSGYSNRSHSIFGAQGEQHGAGLTEDLIISGWIRVLELADLIISGRVEVSGLADDLILLGLDQVSELTNDLIIFG